MHEFIQFRNFFVSSLTRQSSRKTHSFLENVLPLLSDTSMTSKLKGTSNGCVCPTHKEETVLQLQLKYEVVFVGFYLLIGIHCFSDILPNDHEHNNYEIVIRQNDPEILLLSLLGSLLRFKSFS